MNTRAASSAFLLSIAVVLANSIAAAEQPTGKVTSEQSIGKATSVKNQVEGILEGPPRPLSTGSQVFSNELVRTGDGGVAKLIFLDNTGLAVGPKSEIRLDKFVYDAKEAPGSVIVQMTRGAFRFVTGSQDHRNYTINTPYATLGVRGTIFEVVSTLEKIDIHLVTGGLEVRTMLDRVIQLDDSANMLTVLSNGEVQGPFKVPRNRTILDFDVALIRGGGGGGAGGGSGSITPLLGDLLSGGGQNSNSDNSGPPGFNATTGDSSPGGPSGPGGAGSSSFTIPQQPGVPNPGPGVVPVPGPIAGAGLPGLVLAYATFLWARGRQRSKKRSETVAKFGSNPQLPPVDHNASGSDR